MAANTSTPMADALNLSLLDDVCPECGTAAESGFFRYDVPVGDPNFGKLQRCENVYHARQREKRQQQVSQLGPEDIKRRLKDIHRNPDNAAMLDAAQEAVAGGWGWYYFWGGPGNAKSEVLKAIVNECNRAGGGPAMYTSLGRIIQYVKAAFHKDATEDAMARFDKIVNTRVLAIDEMDKVKETEWLQEFRFQFLDARYNSAHNKQTLTVFAGNPNPAEIYDEVLFDRFRDGRWRIIHNPAPSARPAMRR